MNSDQYGSVKKKANSTFGQPSNQISIQQLSSGQNIQSRNDYGGGGIGIGISQGVGSQSQQLFSTNQVRDNPNYVQTQVQPFKMEINNNMKKQESKIEDEVINANGEQSQIKRQPQRDNTVESKKSGQKYNTDNSDPQIVLQYDSEEEEEEEEDEYEYEEEEDNHTNNNNINNHHVKNNQGDNLEDGLEEYKQQQSNYPLSQKNLNSNRQLQQQGQGQKDIKQIDQSSFNKSKKIDQNGNGQQINGQQYQANGFNNNNSSNGNIQSNTNKQQFKQQKGNVGEKLYMNQEKQIENEIDDYEDEEEYNVQASSKIENHIENNTEISQLQLSKNQQQNHNHNNNSFNKNQIDLKQQQQQQQQQQILQQQQQQQQQQQKYGGYKINSLHSNNHEQYLQSIKTQQQNINGQLDSSQNNGKQSNNINNSSNNILDKKYGEQLMSQNTPQNRLSVVDEKFSTEQSDRLNEQNYTSYNTNWNQSISPETKLNRLSHQQMYINNNNNININNQKDSFFKEKDHEHLESDVNNEHMEYINKDKQSLIHFDDVTSKDNSSSTSNNKKQRKYSDTDHIDHNIMQKLGNKSQLQQQQLQQQSSQQQLQSSSQQQQQLQQDSFDNHYSKNHKDQLFIDSSHHLKDIEDSHLKRIISDNNNSHPKKNLLMKEDITVSIADQQQTPPDLGKHIGKEIAISTMNNNNNIIIINNNNSNSNNINTQGTLKQVQNERINTKSSSQSKLQPILNKLELEKNKERKIQKFCQKFFKDLLKNRSGVPTLTQNNRQMNLDSDTPNPDDNLNKMKQSGKEGLLNDGLRKELFNIEEHQKYRLVMDQFLKKFNKSPKDAIQFLIEKQLCDDSEEEIAYMLLTTEGLNKEQLGQFFGGNKERNQSILEAFCSLMDFRNLRFDEAIRLFLSRFRLPGEAQQIDRIVQKFTKVYTNDNPNEFTDEDTPYILCYSAIMLNVDAHSEKIEKSKKMQKATFVLNNLKCTKNAVSKEFLEQLYDNIVKEKFETKVDYIEKIYSRVPIESMNKQFDGQNRIRIIKELQVGSNILKYGRQGKPHMRKIRLNEGRDKIVWNEIDPQVQMNMMLNQKMNGKQPPPTTVKDKSKKERHILIKDITDLTLGCNATEIMKKHNIPPEFDQFCFSIITSNRTFDLKCNDMETKFKWVAFVYNHLNDQRLIRKNKTAFTAEQKILNQERINEIWRLDIFSKWDDHWDYAASKPKNIQKYEKKAEKSSGFFSSICSCLSIKGSNNNNNNNGNIVKIKHNQPNHGQVLSGSKREYEELELAHQSNKSLLLISLWKFGMPKWVRRTIWPLTIGNRLEITENLYNILLKQVQVSQVNVSIANNSITSSIEKMKIDLMNLKGKRLHVGLTESQQKMLANVLSAFIFYRPDVGYINEAMANLATVLILQLDDEYSVFKTFINLLHSYHFLTFFRGEMSEIKWRVQFFNEYLQKRMPLVLQHFKALDLSSELFLMHWFLNLFSNVFESETVFRIWDNFLLEGEVFAFKAGIAFIEYFHLEFKMATFDDAINFLKNPPDDIFCHDLYFDIIEDIKIPVKEFNDRLDQQNVAKLAPYILQQLL